MIVKTIPVDCAFNIPIPFPALANCRNPVVKTPETAHINAAAVVGRFENKPNNNGAVRDTDIKE